MTFWSTAQHSGAAAPVTDPQGPEFWVHVGTLPLVPNVTSQENLEHFIAPHSDHNPYKGWEGLLAFSPRADLNAWPWPGVRSKRLVDTFLGEVELDSRSHQNRLYESAHYVWQMNVVDSDTWLINKKSSACKPRETDGNGLCTQLLRVGDGIALGYDLFQLILLMP